MPDDVPPLPPLRAPERLSFDYRTHGAARVHPMTLYRRALHDLEVRPIETARRVTGGDILVAGIVILRQSPPTAHGVLFVTIEDETGFVQCVVQPLMRERFRDALRSASLIVRARVHAVNTWRGLVVTDVRPLVGVIGGYYGHPAMYGGTDTMELRTEISAPDPAAAVQPAMVRH
jgi:error-prone DNA polymerase